MIVTNAKNADVAGISDVHMGKKDEADDFNYSGSEDALIQLLDSDIPIVVLVGDIADIWETLMREIMNSYRPVFYAVDRRTLRGLKTYFVPGNHDRSKDFPYPREEILVIEDCVFLHGQQFDVFNSKFRVIGRSITKVGAFIERLGWRDVDKVWSKLLKKGRFRSNEEYYKSVEKWVDENPEYTDYLIVSGHSHNFNSVPKQLRNCRVVNTGTRIHGRRDILYFKKEVEAR